MPTPAHTSAVQIEKHILENACTSSWLRYTFKLAIRRDPVDALQDAEVLVTALRTRSLDAYSVGVPFKAELTASLLQQHAEALGQLAKHSVQDVSPSDNARFNGDISVLVMHIQQVASDLVTASQGLNGTTTSQSVRGKVH